MIGNWAAVAASADGIRLAAVNPFTTIYISTNSGANWNASAAPFKMWRSVACSADGTKLIASAANDQVYRSTDSGATWTPLLSGPFSGGCVASSTDGNTLAAGRSDTSSSIYTSTDGGMNWTTNKLPFYCTTVASSADGTKLATACLGNQIYTSTNSGATWVTNATPMRSWTSLASSADGSKLVAASYNGSVGEIYTSTDAGATWTLNNLASQAWTQVAMSADAGLMVAAGSGKIPLYASRTVSVPALNIGLSDTNVLVSWLVSSSDFVLQQNMDLNSTNWETVTNQSSLNFGNLHDELYFAPANSARFYRLITP